MSERVVMVSRDGDWKDLDVLQGNDGEFDAFFRQEYPRLVLRLTVEGLELQAAKDAAQEAMVEAYRNWEEIPET
ncbi:hypothetical protein [Streptomyces sp. enrichment culture]|uniref:hypothetical protein n=1 Tax=Streptomyces sp. enrichment culture TaxID=1795815 RepID=UPI003F5513DD